MHNTSINFAQAKARRLFQRFMPEEYLMKFVILMTSVIISTPVYSGAIECHQNKNDSIEISIYTPHPLQMALVTPDGEWIYFQGPLATNSLFSTDSFHKIAKIEINSKTFGTTWRDGKSIKEKTLSSAGLYKIFISENLETEQENTLSFSCEFNYAPKNL